MNKWHYHAPYVAGLGVVIWVISLKFSVENGRALSWWGQAWFVIAILSLLSLIPGWRRRLVLTAAFFWRIKLRVQAMGGAARPYAQAAGQAVGRGARRVAPHINAGANVVATKVKSDPLLYLMVVLGSLTLMCFGIAAYVESLAWLRFAIIGTFLTVALAITYEDRWGWVAKNWKECWLGLSLLFIPLNFLFGGNEKTAVWFALSALLAVMVIYSKEISKGVGKIYTGGYNWFLTGCVWAFTLCVFGFILIFLEGIGWWEFSRGMYMGVYVPGELFILFGGAGLIVFGLIVYAIFFGGNRFEKMMKDILK